MFQLHVGVSDVILGPQIWDQTFSTDANSTSVYIIVRKFHNFAIWFYVLVAIFLTSTI